MNEYDKNWCLKLISEFNKWPTTGPFRNPVDPIRDQAPRYPEIVKNPMDFSTMKKKINSNEYKTIEDFKNDIKLICNNAKLFNGPESMFGMIVDDIWKETLKAIDEKPLNNEEEWYFSLKNVTNLLQKHINEAPFDVTHILPISLPQNFNINDLNLNQKELISNLIKPFDINELNNHWAFINDINRKKILNIINNV